MMRPPPLCPPWAKMWGGHAFPAPLAPKPMKQTMILSNYDGSVIWQCNLTIGLTLVLLVFIIITMDHILPIFYVGVFQKNTW